MKDLVITENVKNLLLNTDFLELVFGEAIDRSNVNSEKSESIQKLLKSYKLDDVTKAKFVLEHLGDNLGLISEMDVEELRNRIKTCLKH